MIKVGRLLNKIIGNYKVFITNNELTKPEEILKSWDEYVVDKLLAELKNEDNSNMFTYKILKVSCSDSKDLFGVDYEVIFEFVPDPELVEEINLVSERIMVGL
jgi:hypothetical protein